ncbi:YesL family protein [Oceanobacillus oncorhynchi subsp. oncorhynchi]|uniref:YesL family protein n=1 Tax=Oceanobacillus TaxID=182709 RepID=UPI0030DCC23E
MIEKRWYMRVGTLGFNLIYLNLLWVVFTLLGGIVFGIFPATAALFAVIRKMILEDEDTAVLSEFITHFKASFKTSNLLGYAGSFIGLFLVMDFRIVQSISHESVQVVLFNLILVIGILYLVVMLYIFPVYVHFDLKWNEYCRYACILTIARPLQTIMLIAFVAAVVYLYMLVPALVFVLGVSFMSFVIMKIASLSFPKKQVLYEST